MTIAGSRLDQQLCFALSSASTAIVRAYRPLLAELGLTYPQYLVLMALWERDRLSVQEIAARLAMPAHGVTPIVTRLVAAGVVTRHRDPDDGRAVRVTLTPHGAELEADVAEVQEAVGRRAGLSPAAVAELRSSLHALARRLDGDAPDGSHV